jgi:NADH-quinone oxidoreductase subunit G
MKVFTHSAKAVEAQRSVMEFLLINHPLDCPICDQGGECQLQDLSVGYGKSTSRYSEDKRVVFHKNVGPLISMEEMTRCIHCTRCVRFGQEVSGIMELGMVNRGEHSEITTFSGQTIDSELSGNMIDICPVGALTSKPFRYAARTWELGRKRSLSPHDSLGTNTTVQTKANRVMRVVALENEAINECWISDRDRFAYEGVNSAERLTVPMVKQEGKWLETDWESALEYVTRSLKTITADHGADALAAIAHPISSVEELHLLQKVVRAMGSDRVETRLRQTDVRGSATAPWLGMPIANLSQLDRAFVIGSFLRKEQPLIAARLRTATKRGLQISRMDAGGDDWLMPSLGIAAAPSRWTAVLTEVASAIAKANASQLPAGIQGGAISKEAQAIADSLLTGSNKALFLGSAAIAHPHASNLHVLAQFIADQTGATFGFLPVGGNAVAAPLLQAVQQKPNSGIDSVLDGSARAVLLLNVEPLSDLSNPEQSRTALSKADTVIALSAFASSELLELADVLLPITPFTESVGSFINAAGTVQTIQPSVRPLADARPAWKVLRAMGSLLGLNGFLLNTPEEVCGEALAKPIAERLNNRFTAALSLTQEQVVNGLERVTDLPIYGVDAILRRAPALQLTRDAKNAHRLGLNAKTFAELNLKEGDLVAITQGANTVQMPAMLESQLAAGSVRMSASTPASAKLGAMFGPITVNRV